MKRFPGSAAIFSFALASACTERTDCEIAQDTLNRCDAERAAVTEPVSFRRIPLQVTGDCSGLNACLASCINDTNCTTINWVEFAATVDPNTQVPPDAGVFTACVQKCADLRHGL